MSKPEKQIKVSKSLISYWGWTVTFFFWFATIFLVPLLQRKTESAVEEATNTAVEVALTYWHKVQIQFEVYGVVFLAIAAFLMGLWLSRYFDEDYNKPNVQLTIEGLSHEYGFTEDSLKALGIKGASFSNPVFMVVDIMVWNMGEPVKLQHWGMRIKIEGKWLEGFRRNPSGIASLTQTNNVGEEPIIGSDKFLIDMPLDNPDDLETAEIEITLIDFHGNKSKFTKKLEDI